MNGQAVGYVHGYKINLSAYQWMDQRDATEEASSLKLQYQLVSCYQLAQVGKTAARIYHRESKD
jgi:hypothetical protein